MRHFTAKQRAFIRSFVLTRNGFQSALEAGYAESDARSRASKLLAHPEVKREIDRLIKLADSGQQVGEPIPAHGDPLAFLAAVMTSEATDPRLRLDAAKALAAFTIAKPGSRGKREQKDDAAKAAGSGKFQASKPPAKVLPFNRAPRSEDS